jgi:hypothetical protein
MYATELKSFVCPTCGGREFSVDIPLIVTLQYKDGCPIGENTYEELECGRSHVKRIWCQNEDCEDKFYPDPKEETFKEVV